MTVSLNRFAVKGDVRVETRQWKREMNQAARRIRGLVNIIRQMDLQPGLDTRILINRADEPFEDLADIVDDLAPWVIKRADKLLKRINFVTPIDTGQLRGSRGMDTDVTRSTITVTLYFNTDYAMAVHEIMEAYHAPPTQAKFMETTMNQNKAWFNQYVARKLRQIIRAKA